MTTLTKTQAQDGVIATPNGADLYEDQYAEVIGAWEFQKPVTYRRYRFDRDNMTGDIDKDAYVDYNILAEVQTGMIYRTLNKTGELMNGPCTLFVPARIRDASDGSIISHSFRPQIFDEFLEDNIWYVIRTIQPNVVGETEVSFECEGRPKDNLNTIQGWD